MIIYGYFREIGLKSKIVLKNKGVDKNMLLAEKIFLLALDKNKKLIEKDFFKYGLTTAIIKDLERLNRITLENNSIKIINTDELASDILNEAFKIIKREKDAKSLYYWITNLANQISNINDKIINSLNRAKVITINKKKILGIIPKEKIKVIQSKFFIDIKQDLEKTVFNKEKPGIDTQCIISIFHSLQGLSKIIGLST